MKNVKLPNVAGAFYPADKVKLTEMVKTFLKQSQPPQKNKIPRALIAPHAGYVYSGQVAASVYKLLEQIKDKVNKVAVLSPSHFFGLKSLAISDATHFYTPLGEIPVCSKTIEKLKDFPQIEELPKAFEKEHALEVHLPFLQSVLGNFELIPLIVGQVEAQEVYEIIDFFDKENIFMVISSDLSHFHDYDTAKKIDLKTKKTLEKMDYENLAHEDACGYYPLRGLLKWAKENELSLETIDMRNSGDVSGDKSRVVGYGSYIVY
jgi:AmmeMemoRadiSam system protein B